MIVQYHCSCNSGKCIPPLCVHLFQGRCSRENCKYLHPPPHLKTQLEINGRNNLIQQKNMVMLAQQMQLANAMIPGTQLPPMVRGDTGPHVAILGLFSRYFQRAIFKFIIPVCESHCYLPLFCGAAHVLCDARPGHQR